MNAKAYGLGMGTLVTAVLLAFTVMFTVSTTANAQPGKRICVSHAGGGDYIIEVNRGAVCGKHWYMFRGSYNARAFKNGMLTCEETGRWGSTHSFGRSDDDICDGMKTANRRSGHYHNQLDKNGYGWGYINLVCPDFTTTMAGLLWCESKMDQFKQVTANLYHRKTGKISLVATGKCRDAHRCFNPSVVQDFWEIWKDANM